MKKLIISCLLVAITTFTYAQGINFEVGLKGTVNFAKPSSLEKFNATSKSTTGGGIGIYGQFGLLGFFVRPEIGYSFETYQFDLTSTFKSVDFDAHYIRVPILIGKSFLGNMLGIYTGVNLAFKTAEHVNIELNAKDQFKNSTFAIPIGGYVGLGPIKLDIRYNIGLSNLVDIDSDTLSNNTGSFKSNTIELSILYKLAGK